MACRGRREIHTETVSQGGEFVLGEDSPEVLDELLPAGLSDCESVGRKRVAQLGKQGVPLEWGTGASRWMRAGPSLGDHLGFSRLAALGSEGEQAVA